MEAVNPSPLTVNSVNWDDEIVSEDDISESDDAISEESMLSETSSYEDINVILESSLGEDFLNLFAS